MLLVLLGVEKIFGMILLFMKGNVFCGKTLLLLMKSCRYFFKKIMFLFHFL